MNAGLGEIQGAEKQPEGLRGDRQKGRQRGRDPRRKTEDRERAREPAPDDRRREPGDESEDAAARGRRRGAGRRLNRPLFWRRTEGLSSRPWESGGRARAAAMWTVISRIRAGAPRPRRAAREQKAPLCPCERGVTGSAGRVPLRGEGRPENGASVHLAGRLWGPVSGAGRERGRRRGEARGNKTPQRAGS